MIIPAIDIINERIVRLYQGDFAQTQTYDISAVDYLHRLEHQGAKRVHLVDLSRAQQPSIGPSQLIELLVHSSQLRLQIGGGLRSLEAMKHWLALGVEHLVIGSIALTDKPLMHQCIETLGAKLFVLALDVRFDRETQCYWPYTHGWQRRADQSLEAVLREYQALGIREVLCTDIEVDGTLQGPNTHLYQHLCQLFPSLHIQASGGVGCLDDLEAVSQTGVRSVIVGKAFYENRFSLAKAQAAWQRGVASHPPTEHTSSCLQNA